MSGPVEPREIDATITPTSRKVHDALMEHVRRNTRSYVALMLMFGVVAVFALRQSMSDVGARAPVDLPILWIAIAFAIGAVLSLVAKWSIALSLARLTAQDLIGFTPMHDKSVWLHIRNGRPLRTAVLDFDPAVVEAMLPKLPAPPKLRPGLLIAFAAFLAPLGVAAYLNYVPIPVQIVQIESTRGRLELTGKAVLIDGAFVKKGREEYGTLWVTDGSGHCRVLVQADAIPGTERLRHEPGLPVRVVVHSENVRYEGQLMEKIDVLIADSFEALER